MSDRSQPVTDARYTRLLDSLRPLRRLLIAYSGGVDSTLVVKAAADALGADNILAVTGVSASLSAREKELSKSVVTELGLAHRQRFLETREQENPDYQENRPDRCFHCKSELYERLSELAAAEDYPHIANGDNLDDRSDFRPGLAAALDFEVVSPLMQANLTKADVRALASLLALPNHDKPAAPCLASRVPQGRPVKPGELLQVAQAEAYLEELGLRDYRVRHHGDVARIELDPADWELFASQERREQIEKAFQNLGFRFVALDLGGYRMGKAVIR